MRLSDVVTFRDVCASFFVLNFEPEKTKRARTKDGKYKGDDPKTKNINEAYENE
tara:strand:- start:341 stop:502 length:162 start_codon:yes stop_codon:yes gene_type:complete